MNSDKKSRMAKKVPNFFEQTVKSWGKPGESRLYGGFRIF